MIKVFFKKDAKVLFEYKKLFRKAANETMKLLNINKYSEVNVIITNNKKTLIQHIQHILIPPL